MKFFPSAVCGLLLMLPLTASHVFAQANSAQSAPSSPAAKPPSERGITALNPGPTPPAHPITLAQTRELLDLMGYKKMEDDNWTHMIAMNRQQAPFIPEDVWTDVQTGVGNIDYPAMMQPIYAKYMSEEDAAKALEFYRTPAGKRVLQSMPAMLGDSVAASGQKGRQVGREAIEKHRPEIEAAEKKYQAEHAPPAGGTAPGGAAPGGTAPGSTASPAPSTAPSTTPAPSTPPAGSTTPKPQQ